MRKFVAICALLFPIAAIAVEKKSESDYVNETCDGQIEYVLKDKARVDCLLDEYAIEYDWDYKWAEAIGQSLYYAKMTGRKAGVVLIGNDDRYINRFIVATDGLDIKLFIIPK